MHINSEKAKRIKNWITAGMILLLIATVVIFAKLFVTGKFDSAESLQKYMERFGVLAPLALTVFQALQVVIPVIPGFIGCAVGSVMFGPLAGFLCNYIGITAGSIIAYYLARKFGIDIVLLMFSEKTYEKWRKKVEKSKYYDWILFFSAIIPLVPDDFLCYFSGLIKQDAKRFILIEIVGKPWCILGYSLCFSLLASL